MNIQELKKKRKERRKYHVRKDIFGTAERPRLSVHRSLNHIYAQLINDVDRRTIVSMSTLNKEVLEQLKPEMKKTQKSELVGLELAKKALEKNIKSVSFDRNGFLYHGRVKALADAARKGGLEF